MCRIIHFARYFDNISHGSLCCLVGFPCELLFSTCAEIVQTLSAWLYLQWASICPSTQFRTTSPCVVSGTYRKDFACTDTNSTTHVFVRHDATRPTVTPQYEDPFKIFERLKKATLIDMRYAPEVLAFGRAKPAPIEASVPAACHVRF